MWSSRIDYNIPSNNRELQQNKVNIFFSVYYNIPSNNRELQRIRTVKRTFCNYNIPSNNRELQLKTRLLMMILNYNIPSNNRELQLQLQHLEQEKIITYQVITGNYSCSLASDKISVIITYQVITGNYSHKSAIFSFCSIITYQVITGNYSYNVLWESSDNILKKYKWKRKSLAITPSDVNIFSQTSETLNGTAFKNIISCAKAAHDRHSPFAECINAFFSLALIISQSQKK